MDNRSHIRAVGLSNEHGPVSDQATIERPEDSLPPAAYEEGTDEAAWDDFDVPAPRLFTGDNVARSVSALLVAGWTFLFVWSKAATTPGTPTPAQIVGWLSEWAMPVVLIVTLWLLAMRTSTREGRRFADVANALARESVHLEASLAAANRELSLAREFLTAQTRELEFLGRSASERISENAETLKGLIADNSVRVDQIAGVSVTALENMARLRDHLPVVANSAKDVSNQIGGAGREAQVRLEALLGGLAQIEESGARSGELVDQLVTRLKAELSDLDAQVNTLSETIVQRFDAVRSESEEFRNQLDSREVEALAAVRARAEALRLELAETQRLADRNHEAAAHAIVERLAEVRNQADAIADTMDAAQRTAIETWANQIDALRSRLENALREVAELDESALESANTKLRALAEEAEAVDQRIGERNKAFDKEIAERRSALDADDLAASAALARRMSALDDEIAKRREELTHYLDDLSDRSNAVGARVEGLGSTFAQVAEQGREAQEAIAGGLTSLDQKLIETREALDGSDMAIAALTDASVRLLELIQAAAKQTRQDLPEAIEGSSGQLALLDEKTSEIAARIEQSRSASEQLVSALLEAEARGHSALSSLEAIRGQSQDMTRDQTFSLDQLQERLAGIGRDQEALTLSLTTSLRGAIEAIQEDARRAVSALEEQQSTRVLTMAEDLVEKASAKISAALYSDAEDTIERMGEAAKRSASAGREVAVQLRDQLGKVNELAGVLEARVAKAREKAEDQVDNDFARRVALITESLNSNSIDIAKALSTEVTDVAWASYLRGDRGIFTRRAVRLLDNTEAREVAELYDSDHEFRETVNRYIHDFEAMLRTLLSTRDGHAVSVTLLSGDMGKLYVALAQSLERFRQ